MLKRLCSVVQGEGNLIWISSLDRTRLQYVEAIGDVVHEKKHKKLKFAKCTKCGRLNPFRPKSKGMQFTSIYCNNCGNLISFGIRGMDPHINELAEIFCEN